MKEVICVVGRHDQHVEACMGQSRKLSWKGEMVKRKKTRVAVVNGIGLKNYVG